MNRILLLACFLGCCCVVGIIAVLLSNEEATGREEIGGNETSGKTTQEAMALSHEFRNEITIDNLRRHCEQFQAIADENGGNRAAWTSGYQASVEYVVELLTDAGYAIHYSDLIQLRFHEASPATLQVLSGTSDPVFEDRVFGLPGSSSGVVEALVTPVRYDSEFGGCVAEHYSTFPPGNVALLQGGRCSFLTNIYYAHDAGASAVLLIVEENTVNSTIAVADYFGNSFDLPVVLGTTDLGSQLMGQGEVTLRLTTDFEEEERVDRSILAETDSGDPSQTIMIGAHLDSVEQGPGLEDNISGSAAVLELALQLKENGWDNSTILQHRIRFSWWAAEEVGLLGSSQYVHNLSPEEQQEISMYLNMDMIGSPNFVRFVMDGDSSHSQWDDSEIGPPMAQLEATFHEFFDEMELPYIQQPFEDTFMRSDHSPFYQAGIPVSLLHTGTGIQKSEEQAVIFGGTAGEPWDPCYHKSCDTVENLNYTVMKEMTQATAHVIAVYGSKEGNVWG